MSEGAAPATPTESATPAAPPVASPSDALPSTGVSVPVVPAEPTSILSGSDVLPDATPTDAGSEPVKQPTTSEPIARFFDNFSNVDLKNNPTVTRHENVESLAKELVNAQDLIGRKGVIKPGEDADPSLWEKYYTDLGRPATPGEYKLEGFARPEGVGWDVEAIEKPMLDVMHKLGLTESQVTGTFSAFADIQKGGAQKTTEQVNAMVDRTEADLKSEWGLAYDAKVDLATRAANTMVKGGLEALSGVLLADGTNLGNNPTMIRLLADVGELRQEAGLVGEMNGHLKTLTPGEADGAYNQHVAKFRDALLDASHVDHKFAVDEKMRLATLKRG